MQESKWESFLCVWKQNKSKVCCPKAPENFKRYYSYSRRIKKKTMAHPGMVNDEGRNWDQLSWQNMALFSCPTWLTESEAGGRGGLAHYRNRQTWFLGRTLVCMTTAFPYLIDTSVLWAQLFTSPSTTNNKSGRKPLALFFCVSLFHIFIYFLLTFAVSTECTVRSERQCRTVMYGISLCYKYVCSARDTALNWARSNKEPTEEVIYPFLRHIHESNLSSPSSTQSQDVALICL